MVRLVGLVLVALLGLGAAGLLLSAPKGAAEQPAEPPTSGERQIAVPAIPISEPAQAPVQARDQDPGPLDTAPSARHGDEPEALSAPTSVGPEPKAAAEAAPPGGDIPNPAEGSSSEATCDRPPPAPLPAPGAPGFAEFWQTFREPLPPAPVWNPPGRKRVGLQAGHWRLEDAPEELRRLGAGASGGGRAEWEVNLDLARRAAELLRAAGVDVDILPAIVPVGYRAHAFLSIHADGDEAGALRGYKLARAGFSATPEADDRLVAALYETYGEATGLPRDDLHITRRMTAYYAFNSRRYCHAVAPGVSAAILESGFLTSAVDRQVLLGKPDAAARGIANGLLRYLGLA